jgi:hypothetical protein
MHPCPCDPNSDNREVIHAFAQSDLRELRSWGDDSTITSPAGIMGGVHLLSAVSDSLLGTLHELPWPTSPSRRGQGPKRASATTSKPPVCLVNAFTLVVLHGHEGPKHQGVASSPSSRHRNGEWAQLGLIRCGNHAIASR